MEQQNIVVILPFEMLCYILSYLKGIKNLYLKRVCATFDNAIIQINKKNIILQANFIKTIIDTIKNIEPNTEIICSSFYIENRLIKINDDYDELKVFRIETKSLTLGDCCISNNHDCVTKGKRSVEFHSNKINSWSHSCFVSSEPSDKYIFAYENYIYMIFRGTIRILEYDIEKKSMIRNLVCDYSELLNYGKYIPEYFDKYIIFTGCYHTNIIMFDYINRISSKIELDVEPNEEHDESIIYDYKHPYLVFGLFCGLSGDDYYRYRNDGVIKKIGYINLDTKSIHYTETSIKIMKKWDVHARIMNDTLILMYEKNIIFFDLPNLEQIKKYVDNYFKALDISDKFIALKNDRNELCYEIYNNETIDII